MFGDVLSQLAVADGLDHLQDQAEGWDKDLEVLTDLAGHLKQGFAGLVELACHRDVAWQLNHGWRCDVPRSDFRIEACDDYHDRGRVVAFRAKSAEGALAGAILLMQQARAEHYAAGKR